jgi:hypothetical protein
MQFPVLALNAFQNLQQIEYFQVIMQLKNSRQRDPEPNTPLRAT